MSSENPIPAPASDSDLLNEQAILLEYLDTQSIESDDDVISDSVCVQTSNIQDSNLNVAHAGKQPATAAFSARGKIGTFTDLLVPFWARGRVLFKLRQSSTTRTCI